MTNKSLFIPTSRIEAFSDGVFSIVITLLAFQFKVPKLTSGASLRQNVREFLVIYPNFISFLFSFIFVAVFWINHHQLYHSVKEADRKLLWYNIHLLFWITIIPFPTLMLGDHPSLPLPVMVLAFVLMMTSTAAYIIRRYCFRAELLHESLSRESIKDGLAKNVAAIILNFLIIVIAPFYIEVCYFIFIIVLALFIIPQKLELKSRTTKTNNS